MSGASLFVGLAILVAGTSPQTIRIWGPPAMTGVVSRWTEAYSRAHPNVSFEFMMKGSDTAIPGLYSGRADIALMGRENDAVDDNGFSRSLGYPVTRIAIMNGSRASPGKSDALAILVHEDNPLGGLTVSQLGRILDCGTDARLRPVTRWGELGVGGTWSAKPIRIYAYDMASRTGAFLQHVATGDRRRMCWDRISEYADARRLDGTLESAAERIGVAARKDPDALAIANAAEAVEGLKLVPLSGGPGQPFVLPTESSVSDQTYPLSRRAFAFVNRRPGEPVQPKLAAFLNFVLSPAAQAMLKTDRGYLPLDPQSVVASRAMLRGQ